MNILAFDTSTEILSICLMRGDNLFLRESLEGLKHGETLLPSIYRLMADARLTTTDLDLLACSRGPGSFTGLRIGMTTAKGLSEGSGVPIVSVDTLDVLALPFVFFDGAVVPAIDARKSRYYTAVYTAGRRETEQLDCTTDMLVHLLKDKRRVLLTGPGARKLADTLEAERDGVYACSGPLYHTGCSLATLAALEYERRGADGPEQGPVYIRESDAELNRK